MTNIYNLPRGIKIMSEDCHNSKSWAYELSCYCCSFSEVRTPFVSPFGFWPYIKRQGYKGWVCIENQVVCALCKEKVSIKEVVNSIRSFKIKKLKLKIGLAKGIIKRTNRELKKLKEQLDEIQLE